jgi:hypothetical protein
VGTFADMHVRFCIAFLFFSSFFAFRIRFLYQYNVSTDGGSGMKSPFENEGICLRFGDGGRDGRVVLGLLCFLRFIYRRWSWLDAVF